MTAERQRGSVSVVVIAVVVVAGFLALGAARLGHAAAVKARAETAADAAALAAADALALGRGSAAARAAALDIAARNEARLVRCDCSGARATVVVVLGDATARAGAEVVASCRWRPDAC